MQIKVSELKERALDWAVAICEHNVGWEPEGEDRDFYSTDWAQGGPIIEREGISIRQVLTDFWAAEVEAGDYEHDGPTPLIAAMRCYVASKLGDEIEIPDELAKG
jgi:hypothetical protein